MDDPKHLPVDPLMNPGQAEADETTPEEDDEFLTATVWLTHKGESVKGNSYS